MSSGYELGWYLSKRELIAEAMTRQINRNNTTELRQDVDVSNKDVRQEADWVD